jgi:hypothetical protein
MTTGELLHVLREASPNAQVLFCDHVDLEAGGGVVFIRQAEIDEDGNVRLHPHERRID